MSRIKNEFKRWYTHCKIIMEKGKDYKTSARMSAITKIEKYTQAYQNKPDHEFKSVLRNVLYKDLCSILPHHFNNSHQSSLDQLNQLIKP